MTKSLTRLAIFFASVGLLGVCLLIAEIINGFYEYIPQFAVREALWPLLYIGIAVFCVLLKGIIPNEN